MIETIFVHLAAVVFLVLTGCASNVSPSSYSVGSVGQINRTIGGKIISAREIQIRGTSDVGGTSGAVLGATAGSSVGGGGRSGLAGVVVGALVGGTAGAAIEQNSTRQVGIEYVISTDNNNLMTIVQGSLPLFVVGDKVLVLYGSPARIIADPR